MEEQEQQLDHMIGWYRLMGKQEMVQSLIAAKQFRDGMKEIQRSVGRSQDQWDEVSQALLDMAKEQSETCTHPELTTLPVSLDRLHGIMCSSCGKTLSLMYSDFLNGVPCIATLVKEEFGTTWEQRAIMWCQCEEHKEVEG